MLIAYGASSAEIAARYRLGQHLFRDAGHFSLLSGVVATLLGLIIVLSNLSAANQMGHHVAVTLTGFLYGFVVAIFCYALSSNLRHKGEQVNGTRRALEQAASGLGETANPPRTPANSVLATAPAGAS